MFFLLIKLFWLFRRLWMRCVGLRWAALTNGSGWISRTWTTCPRPVDTRDPTSIQTLPGSQTNNFISLWWLLFSEVYWKLLLICFKRYFFLVIFLIGLELLKKFLKVSYSTKTSTSTNILCQFVYLQLWCTYYFCVNRASFPRPFILLPGVSRELKSTEGYIYSKSLQLYLPAPSYPYYFRWTINWRRWVGGISPRFPLGKAISSHCEAPL